MRIHVIGENSISRQARTYAEYRLFAALSEATDTYRIRGAVLILGQTDDGRTGSRAHCAVSIETDRGERLRIRTRGEHPYAAINRAVERIRARRWPSRVVRPLIERSAAE